MPALSSTDSLPLLNDGVSVEYAWGCRGRSCRFDSHLPPRPRVVGLSMRRPVHLLAPLAKMIHLFCSFCLKRLYRHTSIVNNLSNLHLYINDQILEHLELEPSRAPPSYSRLPRMLDVTEAFWLSLSVLPIVAQ